MVTLTLDKPIDTTEPVVALDPKLKPGRYRATVMLNGDATLSASVVLIVSRVVRPGGPVIVPPIRQPVRQPIVTPILATPVAVPVRPIPKPPRGPVVPQPESAIIRPDPPKPKRIRKAAAKPRAKPRKRTDGPE